MTEPKLYIFSGAGLSAESGIPTFRSGDDALWDNHSLDDVCYLPSFEKNYAIAHQFYNDRRAEFFSKKPNAAHLQIAKWEEQYGSDRVVNFTTNIDMLLEEAGCTNVHHLHGRGDQIIRGWNHATSKGTHIQTIGDTPCLYEEYLRNGEFVKPNVVFFGEACVHTINGTEPLYQHLQNALCDINSQDTFIVVGASFQVVPIHYNMMFVPFMTINVNPDEEQADETIGCFNIQRTERAGVGLPKLNSVVTTRMGA